MNKFEVNGKEYKAKAFDFNTVCDLEDMGISSQMMKDKPMSTVRAYFALCLGGNRELAGKEIEEHIKLGGSLEDVYVAMNEEIEKSDFFRAIRKRAEEDIAESETNAEK